MFFKSTKNICFTFREFEKPYQPQLASAGFHVGPLIILTTGNLKMVVFVKQRPPQKPLEHCRNQQQTQCVYGTRPELEPGHVGGRQALSPLCHPCSP